MKYEFKTFEMNTVNRNDRVISKDAFNDQDGKIVPLKWGNDKDPFVIGSAELDVGSNGMYVKCDITCSKEDYINHYLTKPQRILRKIKKRLGIVSPSEERWPWEEQNCDLSMKFKEDYKNDRNY
jgi:hypothetical protein